MSGTLTPFLSEIFPSFFTLQTTSCPTIFSTSILIRPSSIKITEPGSTSLYKSGYVMFTRFSSPMIFSPPTNVNVWPEKTWTLPFSKLPVLISGPFVSNNMATGLLHFSLNSLTLFILPKCSSWEPWEKLHLATFKPFLINSSNTLSLSVAGPNVQTILVFLISAFTSCLFSFYNITMNLYLYKLKICKKMRSNFINFYFCLLLR